MIIGGAAAIMRPPEEMEVEPAVPVAELSGNEVLATDEFWGDLKGFLVQRFKNEQEGERVWKLFKGAVH